MKLVAKATIQIQKPVEEVFENVVNPDHMTQYFISETMGRMEPGSALIWKFPEFPDEFPVNEIQVEENRSVSFVWDPETIVRIDLEPRPDQSTVIRVSEDGKEINEANIQWVIGNSEGWANFLACLKAWMEYGIHLRSGAFDFMQKM